MFVENYFFSSNFSIPSFKTEALAKEVITTQKKVEVDYDKIFAYLQKEGIVNASCQLNENFEKFIPPDLHQTQIDRFNSIFSAKRTFTVKNTSIQIKFSLQDLLVFLEKEKIELVGGTVFWVLGIDYFKRLNSKLKLPNDLLPSDFFDLLEKRAVDVDIRIPLELNENPADFTKKTVLFFQNRIDLKCCEALQKDGFKKFYIQNNLSTGEHFSIISFSTTDECQFDLVFKKKLARERLFEHDALKIEANYFTRPFRVLKLESNTTSVLMPLLLKMTKILDGKELEGINPSGACMLISYLTKGYRYHSKELEEKCLIKLANNTNFLNLNTTLENHFPNDPFAALIFTLYIAYLLPENGRSFLPNDPRTAFQLVADKLLPAQKEKIENQKDCFLKHLFHFVDLTLSLKESFQLISTYLQIFGYLINKLKKEGKNVLTDASFTEINGSRCLQLRFKPSHHSDPLYFTMRDDFVNSLTHFKLLIENLSETSKEKLLPIFEKMTECLEIHFSGQFLIKDFKELENNKSLIFSFFESEELILQDFGFFLLSCLGIQEKNDKYLPGLLSKITDFKSDKFKNKFYTLLHYQEACLFGENKRKIEDFRALISAPDYNSLNLTKDFLLSFASFKNPRFITFIFNACQKEKGLFTPSEIFELLKLTVNHSPEASIALLEHFIKELPLDHAKYLFLQILKSYQQPNNQLFFERDSEKLTRFAIELLHRFIPTKKIMNEAESKPYLLLARQILAVNFLKGLELLQILEEKKILSKDFSQVIKGAETKDRTLLILNQHKHIQLDYSKAPISILEERLQLLLSCDFDPKETDIHNELREELGLYLINLVRNGKTISRNIKNILKPKLEWISFELLKKPTYLFDYFKICKEFDLQMTLKNNLLPSLTICMQKFSLKNPLEQKTSVTIHTFIANINTPSRKSPKQYSNELIDFYKALISLSLKDSNSEIACIYLEKIMNNMRCNNQLPDCAFLTFFDECLSFFIINENILLAFSLLKQFEQNFQSVEVLNKKERWITILLNSTEDDVKLAATLIDKTNLFEGNNEIKKKAISITKELLSSSKINNTTFTLAIELIKNYSLHSKEIIDSAVIAFKNLKNSKLKEEYIQILLIEDVPLTRLTPLFNFFLSEPSQIFHFCAKNINLLLMRLNKEDDQKEKFTFLFILAKGFLTILSENDPIYPNIIATLPLIIEELNNYKEFELSHKTELLLDEATAYSTFLDPKLNDFCWTSLTTLTGFKDIHPYQEQLLTLYCKVFETSLKSEELKINFSNHIKNVMSLLFPFITANNFKFLANQLTKKSSRPLIKTIGYFAKALVDGCPTTKPSELKEPYLLFKSDLKKLLFILLEKNNPSDLHNFCFSLLSEKFFTDKEISDFAKSFTIAFFEDPETIKYPDRIISAIGLFLEGFKEPLKQGTQLIRQVVLHLLTLNLKFNQKKYYNNFLGMLFKRYFSWIAHEPIYHKFINSIHKDSKYSQSIFKQIPVKLGTNELVKQAKNNCFEFLYFLSESISSHFLKKGVVNVENEETLKSNAYHLFALIYLFPEKKYEIIQASQNFCYTSLFYHSSQTEFITTLNTKNIELMYYVNFFEKMDKKTEEAAFKLSIFTSIGPEFKTYNLNIQTQARIIFEIIQDLLGFNTLRAIVLGYTYLSCYLPFLEKIKKNHPLAANLMTLFKKHYPNEKRSFYDVMGLLQDEFSEKGSMNYPDIPF